MKNAVEVSYDATVPKAKLQYDFEDSVLMWYERSDENCLHDAISYRNINADILIILTETI